MLRARPQLREPPLAPRGGRWAGMASRDTYIGTGGGGVGTHEGWRWEGASSQGNPTPGAGLQGEGKAEASRACWTRAGDRAQLGKPPGAQGTRGARTPQLRGQRRKAARAALEGPRFCIAVGSSAVQAAPEGCARRVPRAPGSRNQSGGPRVPGHLVETCC